LAPNYKSRLVHVEPLKLSGSVLLDNLTRRSRGAGD